MRLELFTTKTCPYCAEVREQLDGDGAEYTEYDVEVDGDARSRLVALVGPHALVPVLVEDGRVSVVGAAGRGCFIGGR
jgi:glutaredoxin 3